MANLKARALRKAMTPAEKRLWGALRRQQLAGRRFRRQHPLGPFFVDFICLEMKLIVELDGAHHGADRQMAHDLDRDVWLESRGYRVVRFWNEEVTRELDQVLERIDLLLRDPTYGSPHA